MPEPLLQVDNLKMYFPVRSGIFLRQAGWVKAVDDAVSYTHLTLPTTERV